MRGFLDMPSRTDARTDARTDKRESIGLSAEAERPKTPTMSPHAMYFWPKKGLNGQIEIFPGTFTGLFYK